jgi:large subunit ribosomal protein L37Ae
MSNASIRHGVSLRKRRMAVQAEKRAKYECDMCGKTQVRRVGSGIWKCRRCGATYAGGAYSFKTTSATTLTRAVVEGKK